MGRVGRPARLLVVASDTATGARAVLLSDPNRNIRSVLLLAGTDRLRMGAIGPLPTVRPAERTPAIRESSACLAML